MTEETIEHAADVVAHVTVVAARHPLLLKALGYLVDVVDLVDGDAAVRIVQRLIIQVRIRIPLYAKGFLDAGVAPAGPAVGCEHHLGFLPELVKRDVELLSS